jgi:diguanylate cyclase (GGDEF)-like protein
LSYGVVLGFIALAVMVAQQRWIRQLRGELLAALRKAEHLDRELLAADRREQQNAQDRQFFMTFLREFPHLTRELHSGIKERQIPHVLLKVAQRAFEPQAALVLVRRRRADTDPDRAGRLVVAAISPKGGAVPLGSEVALGRGELGYAAEMQRLLSRHDLDGLAPGLRVRLRQDNLPGFDADLLAPVVFGGDTLGLIALSRPARAGEEAKAALRLVAEIGAKSLHDSVAFSQMKTSADLDGLTGVFNKKRTTQVLAEALFEAQRKLEPISVFLFDIDSFKAYNDTHGHLAGDGLLQGLARLVEENVRRDDVFGRFGGEEFLLILPRTAKSQALSVADKLRAAIAAHPFPFGHQQPLGALTVSGGVAEYPSDAHDSADLLRAADKALYAAKRQGRNCVLGADSGYLSGNEPEPGPEPDGMLPQ